VAASRWPLAAAGVAAATAAAAAGICTGTTPSSSVEPGPIPHGAHAEITVWHCSARQCRALRQRCCRRKRYWQPRHCTAGPPTPHLCCGVQDHAAQWMSSAFLLRAPSSAPHMAAAGAVHVDAHDGAKPVRQVPPPALKIGVGQLTLQRELAYCLLRRRWCH